jgi:hypothetical protein
MLRRTPLRPKPRKRATQAERAHMERVAGMGCTICGGWAEVHHVVSDGFKRLSRDHRRVVPLCGNAHRNGRDAVHRIGHAAFNALHGVDLLATADRLWSESCAT